MKITHVTTRVLRTPADNPLVVGLPAPTDTREFVTLELGTDQGLVGVGLTFFGGALTAALKVAVDTLAGLVVGDDPTQTEAIAAKLRRAAGSSGPGGIFTLALSAIDTACWDIRGKALGQSVCALLGGLRDRVPTYASGALMRPHPVDYLAKAGPRLRDMGFRQMKMQCGSEPSVAASIERVRVMQVERFRPHRSPVVHMRPDGCPNRFDLLHRKARVLQNCIDDRGCLVGVIDT